MEPRIQYARTADGVSIAFATLGEGMPLVQMPQFPWSHVQLEWQMPEFRRWCELAAAKRMLVRYDGRGSGLSDRDVTDYSVDAHIRDVEAVLDRLGLERASLMGCGNSGPVAIAYAARHPERVSHLLLWQTWARTSDIYQSSQLQTIRTLMQQDWELYLETLAHALFGWSKGEFAHRYATFLRQCVTPDGAQATLSTIGGFDSTPLLAEVKCPTLVLHVRQAPFPHVALARGLAASIPDARLALLEGESVALLGGIEERGSAVIDEFLGEREEARAGALPEGMAVILFTDIAESTSLTEQLGDAGFRAKARDLDERLRAVIREAGGTPVEGKVLGDGVMAVFTSARQAIECALRCNAATEGSGLQLHLGIHAGDVIREGNNVYGGAVNIAARVAGASAPGEILVSDAVRSIARTSAGVVFEDRGEHELKGVGEPQRLFAVREQG